MTSPSDSQLAVLELLSEVLPKDAYLAGGVAVAVRYRHRISHDLDIFTIDSDPTTLAETPHGEGWVVTTRAADTLYLEINGVPVSVLRHRYPLIAPAEKLAEVPVPLASVADLTAMKVHAIASRGAARDFWDLHTLIKRRDISLVDAIAEHSERYAGEDAGHVVRSLAYFGDADSCPLPRGLEPTAWAAIRADFERWVRGV